MRGEISPDCIKVAPLDPRPLGLCMHLGKSVPKLVPSFSRRKIRLGVAHHGAPSRWSAPVKDVATERTGKVQKKRR